MIGLMVAIKYFDDVYYDNRFYSKVGGIALEEVNRLEAEFINNI